ncbi:hypothetical protein [Paenibacillus thalictri]|uniref:Uncharacterized protein n=1 Tax=Paenibacillus thalictri TaxID=2527873 RepID=A0A4Q9DSF9_9BACL|nr:hypothetical protein [Paenibacillus thalictri]TBL79814.1 hypothetical protein EYB31_09425 [Paenibacillus thalictri]
MDQAWLIGGLLGLIVVVGLIFWRAAARKKQEGKVTSLKKYRRHAAKLQPCSYCRKKSAPLAFYADQQGKVIGVCRNCKPIAERQELMRM